jgi:heat shock protein HslJ
VSDASVLIGSWRVEAAGEEPGAVLRIDGDFALQRRCGELGGVWAAVGDQFVALMFHADAACAPGTGTEFTPRWVARLQRFTMDGGRPILLDGAGAVVARLTPLEGAPADEAVRAAWRRENLPAAPLPAGLTPATRERVLGRWLPVEDPRPVRREQAYVLFAADGSWTGSDGCNGEGGQWALGERGVFAAASGPSTKIGCSNAALGMGFGVHRAAFAGGDLVLLNRKGKELARFRQG